MNWTEWLATGETMELAGLESTWVLLLVALAGSLLTSVVVALLCRRFYPGAESGSQVHLAFPLIGPAITAIFIAVQFSLPLSLGLLGALSIVRFRTPIKDGREIGFILLVVALSLSWATLNLSLLGLLLAVAVVGMAICARLPALRRPAGAGLLAIRMKSDDYERLAREVDAVVRDEIPDSRLDSITEDQSVSTVSFRFRRTAPEVFVGLRKRLSGLCPDLDSQVFFFDRS